MSEDDISTADTMRERAGESKIKLWLLVGANRLVVAAVLALAFFGLFMLGGLLDPTLSDRLTHRSVIAWIFGSMIGALVTGVTLVVTISQLIVSQENGPLGKQQTRMSETMDVREYVAELVEEPAPADPSAFLRAIVDATETRAEALREIAAETRDPDLQEEVEEFVNSTTDNAETVRGQLEGTKFGSFDVVFAALNFNYGWKIFQVERIGDEYEEVLDEDGHAALADLRTALSMFGPAREHVKTLYFQWALIDLSRMILYVAIPALLVAGSMLTFVDPTTISGRTLGIENLLWVVAVAFTFTLVPFLLLTSYVLRIATTAKRTLAIGPLILRNSQR